MYFLSFGIGELTPAIVYKNGGPPKLLLLKETRLFAIFNFSEVNLGHVNAFRLSIVLQRVGAGGESLQHPGDFVNVYLSHTPQEGCCEPELIEISFLTISGWSAEGRPHCF